MCDHENREAAMVVVRQDENDRPTVWCDPCLEPLIRALNDGGIATASSCCGHDGKGSDGEQTEAPGWVMLRDGRTLSICPPSVPTGGEHGTDLRDRIHEAATTAINSAYGTDDRHAYMGWRIAINVVNGTPLPWSYLATRRETETDPTPEES